VGYYFGVLVSFTYNSAETVNRSTVHALGLVRSVLDLKPGFDVFDGRSDKRDGYTGHDTCNTVTKGWEGLEIRLAAAEGDVRA
jgi:hypothetical protein